MNPIIFLIMVVFLANNPCSGDDSPIEPLAHWYTPRLLVPIEEDPIYMLNLKEIENLYKDLLKTCINLFPECQSRCTLKSKPLDKRSK